MRFSFASAAFLFAAVSTVFAHPIEQLNARDFNDLEVRALPSNAILYERDFGPADIFIRDYDASQYFTRDVPAYDLELRDVVEDLVRRSRSPPHGKGRGKGKGKAPAAPRRSKAKSKPKFQKKMPVTWRNKAHQDLKHPLASTWKHGQNPKAMHEAIVRQHGKNKVPGAHGAQIFRGAHPGGHNPTEPDHITTKYFDKHGKKIHDADGNDLHHVYTGREKFMDVHSGTLHSSSPPPAHARHH
ncbi:hypothetical protein C8Q75DRAFT_372857 [Abortiporus biennis]|nr:hypothetical protein C8Q75DRAFT_372857 [Abortiporus biennis]